MTSRELLKTGAEELGVPVTNEQIDALFLYIAELKKWNRKINLTAITEDREIVIKHLLDSLSYLKGFDSVPGAELFDMGSGGGFPAIPIKIACPALSITMVESVKKKAAFLRHIVRTLSLDNAKVIDQRTDDLPDSYRTSYDVVTARAFADIKSALTQGTPFLKTDGLIVLSRGPEETVGDQELNEIGLVLKKKLDLTLPHSDNNRAIWVFSRTGSAAQEQRTTDKN